MLTLTYNGSKFQEGTLKIFNVINENEVISNLNFTFIYIKFHANLYKNLMKNVLNFVKFYEK